MPFPRKGTRAVTVDGVRYQWHLDRDFDKENRWRLVKKEGSAGQMLWVDPYHHDFSFPGSVVEAIRFAVKLGWNPGSKGQPLRLVYDGKSFSPVSKVFDIFRHLPTILARWNGSSARMAEMTRGHRTLRLELRHPKRAGTLIVACLDPDFVQGPTDWSDAQLTAEIGEGDCFVLRDQRAGVLIKAGHIELKEKED